MGGMASSGTGQATFWESVISPNSESGVKGRLQGVIGDGRAAIEAEAFANFASLLRARLRRDEALEFS